MQVKQHSDPLIRVAVCVPGGCGVREDGLALVGHKPLRQVPRLLHPGRVCTYTTGRLTNTGAIQTC